MAFTDRCLQLVTLRGPLGRTLREGTFVGSEQVRAELSGCKLIGSER